MYFKVVFISCKEWCLFYRYVDRSVIYKLYYRKVFDPIILVIINIAFEILFNSLVEPFYLSIGLKMKGYRKFVVYF